MKSISLFLRFALFGLIIFDHVVFAEMVKKEKDSCSIQIREWDFTEIPEEDFYMAVVKELGSRFEIVNDPSAKKQIMISSIFRKKKDDIIFIIQIKDRESGKEIREQMKVGSYIDLGKNIEKLIPKIYSLLAEHFPLIGRILTIEGNEVTVDVGRNAGFKDGTYVDVFNEEKKVGILRLVIVNEEDSVGKILRGKGNIMEGMRVEEYDAPSKGMIFTTVFNPFIEIVPNPSYIGTPSSKSFGNTGRIWQAGTIRKYEGWGWDSGIGWADMQLERALQANSNIFLNYVLLVERLDIQLGGGGGLVLSFSEQKWARESGVRYKEKSGINSGKASPVFGGNLQTFLGLNVHLHRKLSIFSRAGFYGFIFGFNWMDTDNKIDDIKDEWLEYKVKQNMGFGYEVGLVWWEVPVWW